MNTLTQQQIVMHHGASSALVKFSEALDGPGFARGVTVTPLAWEDMGSPETITVTIEPGDRLNPATP